jgi:hypothetical protein
MHEIRFATHFAEMKGWDKEDLSNYFITGQFDFD